MKGNEAVSGLSTGLVNSYWLLKHCSNIQIYFVVCFWSCIFKNSNSKQHFWTFPQVFIDTFWKETINLGLSFNIQLATCLNCLNEPAFSLTEISISQRSTVVLAEMDQELQTKFFSSAIEISWSRKSEKFSGTENKTWTACVKGEGKPKKEAGANLLTVFRTGLQTTSKCSRTSEKSQHLEGPIKL